MVSTRTSTAMHIYRVATCVILVILANSVRSSIVYYATVSSSGSDIRSEHNTGHGHVEIGLKAAVVDDRCVVVEFCRLLQLH